MGSNERKRRANRKQAIYLIVFALLLFAGLNFYRSYLVKADLAAVKFTNQDGKETAVFHLEKAEDKASWRKGLKFRKAGELLPDGGMLFIFPDEEQRSFWMKDVYIPLDMIFIGADKKVVGIVHNAPIMNSAPRMVDGKSKYVVELLGGEAKKAGISKGSLLRILN
jgi:uncharacterized membrane protein (UPF0127 family)